MNGSLYNINDLSLPMWTQVIATDEYERDCHMERQEEMIRGYHGQAYEATKGPLTPENFYYTYVTNTVPGLVVDNPRVLVRSRRAGAEDPISGPMKHGLNRWVRDENISYTLKLIAQDLCFSWGVGMVTNEPDLHQGTIEDQAMFDENRRLRTDGGKKSRPRFYRLSPYMFGADSRGLDLNRAGHMFHQWFASAADIEAEAENDDGWNKDEVKSLVTSAVSGRDAASVADPSRRSINSSIKTDELEFYSVWVPSMTVDGKGPDTGHHGAILTFARSSTGTSGNALCMPRDPEPYFGPASGPYTVFGARTVPDKLWPLSDLCAHQASIQELNRHSRAISRSNSRGKNVLLYDMADKSVAEQIKNAQGEFMIGVPHLAQNGVVQATFGFASPQQYTAHAMFKDQLQRNSGMNDAQQGNVNGTGTATENQIANDVTLRRNNALYRTFSDATNACLKKVAHFFFWDDTIQFPLGEEFFADNPDLPVEEGQYAIFKGGQQKGNRALDLADYELEIEAYSMGRTDQAQLSASLQQWMGYMLPSLQFRPMMPWVDWHALDELYAQQLNTPELARIIDNKAAVAQGPWEDGGETPQPQFSRDMLPSGAGVPQVKMNRPQPAVQAPPQPMQ